jgi:hypothetical protein
MSIPRTLARYVAAGADPSRFSIKKQDYLARNSSIFRLLDSIEGPNVTRIFPHERLCRDDTCVVYANGSPLYFDAQHLSVSGAEYLEPLFEDLFTPTMVAMGKTAAAQ